MNSAVQVHQVLTEVQYSTRTADLGDMICVAAEVWTDVPLRVLPVNFRTEY